jgi:phosphoglycerol transferase MdoB-like AlkP superfamily enzyme
VSEQSPLNWKGLSIALNLAGMFLFLVTAALVFLWPEHLARFGLGAQTSRMLLMQEISALLLLGAFQHNLSRAWQRAALLGSFLVLAEAALIGML